MNRPVVFRTVADNQAQAAYRWYEKQQRGLGSRFLQAVKAGAAALERNPELYPVVTKDIHRIILHRFPYGLFYIILPESVEVIACLHSRRNPRLWRRR